MNFGEGAVLVPMGLGSSSVLGLRLGRGAVGGGVRNEGVEERGGILTGVEGREREREMDFDGDCAAA